MERLSFPPDVPRIESGDSEVDVTLSTETEMAMIENCRRCCALMDAIQTCSGCRRQTARKYMQRYGSKYFCIDCWEE